MPRPPPILIFCDTSLCESTKQSRPWANALALGLNVFGLFIAFHLNIRFVYSYYVSRKKLDFRDFLKMNSLWVAVRTSSPYNTRGHHLLVTNAHCRCLRSITFSINNRRHNKKAHKPLIRSNTALAVTCTRPKQLRIYIDPQNLNARRIPHPLLNAKNRYHLN